MANAESEPVRRSAEAYEEASAFLVGGVNSPVRAFQAVGGTPVFVASGQGATITDVDGRPYIDYVGSWGPLILGHAHPRVVAAVTEAARRGTSFGAPTEQETTLAKMIVDRVPSMEAVRLVNSGTEACMSAIRLARGYTGRSKIIKFAGCYHGHVDALLVDAGSGALTFGTPSSPGVTKATAGETLVAGFNDLDAAARVFESHGSDIAAVIVEPVAGNMGLVLPADGFLAGLRQLCSRFEAVLIFDEVMTGFRVGSGGAQALYGVMPDLTCLGKIVGGGLPLAAYGGRREIMNHLAPVGPVYQAGTLSGNPIATAAGIATLSELDDEAYRVLENRSARLADGLIQAADGAGVPIQCARVGSMLRTFFTNNPVTNLKSATICDTSAYATFFHAMLKRGIYLAPSQFECAFVSTAHTEDDIARTVSAARESFEAVARS